MLKEVVSRIEQRLAALKISASAASSRAGLSRDAIRNMQRAAAEDSRQGASTNTLLALAPVLETSAAWLLTGEGAEEYRTIPIVGKAGAGPDGTVLFATGDGNFGEIPAPTNSVPTTVALVVQGDSMKGTASDGWIVTYDDKGPPREDHMGEPCVCWLEDDRVLIKTPFWGRGPGLFDLESENASTMRDIPVRYMALVTNIVPRRAAEKFIRRRPDYPIEDVTIARQSPASRVKA